MGNGACELPVSVPPSCLASAPPAVAVQGGRRWQGIQWWLNPLQQALQAAEAAMEGRGRVLVRASGTEPLLRVMVEAADQQLVDHWSSELAAAAEQHLNAV